MFGRQKTCYVLLFTHAPFGTEGVQERIFSCAYSQVERDLERKLPVELGAGLELSRAGD